MSRVIRRPRLAFAALAVIVALLAGPASAAAAKAEAADLGILFGLSTAPDGSLLVADATQGIVAIDSKGNRTLVAALPGAADVDAVGAGNLYAITGGGAPDTGEATLYRVSNGHVAAIADLGAYEEEFNPDGTDINPNPFDVEVLNGGGVLVADAGANTLYYVTNKGAIVVVATFPEELVSTANVQALMGCPEGPADICGLPAMIPAQPVSTSVAIGPDGAAYVGELKGFPAPTGESRIWRIEPGAVGVECGVDPECTVVGDGFTSIIDLQFGPDGTLYVTELDEASWWAVEVLMAPTGGTINACEWGSFPFECTVVADGLMIPTATTVGKDGQLYSTIWSLVPGQADVIAVE
jgi:hypothetical protein